MKDYGGLIRIYIVDDVADDVIYVLLGSRLRYAQPQHSIKVHPPPLDNFVFGHGTLVPDDAQFHSREVRGDREHESGQDK